MRDHRGLLSRAEGCWTFDARDRMSRSSRLLVHPIIAAAENAQTKTRTPSRESGFVLRRYPVIHGAAAKGPLSAPTADLATFITEVGFRGMSRRCRRAMSGALAG